MWENPIYDRTQSDIDNKTSKGYLNVSDMNRIEGNIAYLGEIMGVTVNTKTWVSTTLPSTSDFERIKNNINALEQKINFTTYESLPNSPINHYEKLNKIEQIMLTVYWDWELFIGQILFGGEGYCGSELI